jgi:hypothetical protein
VSSDFLGEPTRSVGNSHLRMEYLANGGPRIVRAFVNGSDETLFAEVPGGKTQTPWGVYRFKGGHRLWHSPEGMPRTYVPDDEGQTVEEIDGGVRLIQATEKPTGIAKTIEIRLHSDQPAATVVHELRNDGMWPVELAPWALTQLPLGGVAVLPQTAGAIDAPGLLPNRNLSLWSYNSWTDGRLQLFDDYLLLYGQPKVPPIKVGYMNRVGWIGYLRKGVFFCKRITPQPSLLHSDFGCNTESYCSDEFLEAETLGPMQKLEPGKVVRHVEEWEFYSGIEAPQTIEGIRSMVHKLGL